MSNDEASGAHSDVSVSSEEQEVAHAKGTAKDGDDNDQDADFAGADDLSASEEHTQGDDDDGDEGVDNTLITTHASKPEEGDELPWDKASHAEDPLPLQPMPCYNL